MPTSRSASSAHRSRPSASSRIGCWSCGAARSALDERLEQARQRRDGATGSEARTEAERAAAVASTRDLAELDGPIDRLENRDDDTFQQYQQHIQRRRYAPPRVERVFDLDLVIE